MSREALDAGDGLDASRAKEADNALIFGGGPIGLLLAIGMQVRGVKEISIVDINEALTGNFPAGSMKIQWQSGL